MGIDGKSIEKALQRDEFSDVEDCLQDECALLCGAKYIVTRNVEDYKNSNIPALTPDDLLKLL